MVEIEKAWRAGKAYKIQQIDSEFKEFLLLCYEKIVGGVCLEIGSYDGGVLAAFKELGAKRLISVDLEHRFELEGVEKVQGSSYAPETVAAVKKLLGRTKLDVLFIDGDHTKEGALKDYEAYKGFVKKGGVIVFHDIVDSHHHRVLDCFVSEAWEQVREGKDAHEIRHSDNWAGIGFITV